MPRGQPVAWSDDDLLDLLARRDRGQTAKQIGREIGRPMSTVASALQRLDSDFFDSTDVPRARCLIW